MTDTTETADDPLAAVLATARAAGPTAACTPTCEELRDLSLAMAREVVRAERSADARRRVQRRRRQVAGLATAAVLLVPAAAYAAEQLLARTGEYGAAGQTDHDTSEWIDLCAPDLPAYVRSLPEPTDPPPPAMTWSDVADEVVANLRTASAQECPNPGAVTPETRVRSDFYSLAEGHWAHAALADHAAGHDEQAREKARMVALQQTRLDELGVLGDDGWKVLHDAALAGDWDALRRAYGSPSRAWGTR